MKHIMLDLETMGVNPGCVILSIGACQFDDEKIIDRFYAKVDFIESVRNGFSIDPETVMWWMNESTEARQEVFKEAKQPLTVIREFDNWLPFLEEYAVWGNGAGFDNKIIMPYLKRFLDVMPWSHRQDRCYRTIASLYPDEVKRIGLHHKALDDACTQAEHLIMLNNKYNLNIL